MHINSKLNPTHGFSPLYNLYLGPVKNADLQKVYFKAPLAKVCFKVGPLFDPPLLCEFCTVLPGTAFVTCACMREPCCTQQRGEIDMNKCCPEGLKNGMFLKYGDESPIFVLKFQVACICFTSRGLTGQYYLKGRPPRKSRPLSVSQ